MEAIDDQIDSTHKSEPMMPAVDSTAHSIPDGGDDIGTWMRLFMNSGDGDGDGENEPAEQQQGIFTPPLKNLQNQESMISLQQHEQQQPAPKRPRMCAPQQDMPQLVAKLINYKTLLLRERAVLDETSKVMRRKIIELKLLIEAEQEENARLAAVANWEFQMQPF